MTEITWDNTSRITRRGRDQYGNLWIHHTESGYWIVSAVTTGLYGSGEGPDEALLDLAHKMVRIESYSRKKNAL